jgi:ABC-type Mn2+/Zn2+ transport system ATPase subunit
MNAQAPVVAIDPQEEQAFYDSIDRWIEREVTPQVVMHHDHGDIWPAELV